MDAKGASINTGTQKMFSSAIHNNATDHVEDATGLIDA